MNTTIEDRFDALKTKVCQMNCCRGDFCEGHEDDSSFDEIKAFLKEEIAALRGRMVKAAEQKAEIFEPAYELPDIAYVDGLRVAIEIINTTS